MIRKFLIFLFLFSITVSPYAQVRKTVKKSHPSSYKKRAKRISAKNTASFSGSSIKNLQNQRQQLQRNIKEQEKLLKSNQRDVKQRLQALMIINGEIDERRKSIAAIEKEIYGLSNNINLLQVQLNNLETELNARKQKYKKSLQYMYRNRSIQNKLMFIFSAKNFTQMFRRMRFVREYATYQHAQGELVKNKQLQVQQKQSELLNVKGKKDVMLYKGQQEHKALQGKQNEQQKVVTTLQSQQRTIQTVLTQQRRQDEALNARIDRLIAMEVAKAKAREEAEASRKARAEAARKMAAEIARKKALAEATARENARKIAEAKQAEARLKAAAKAAASRSLAEKNAAKRAADAAESVRMAAETKAKEDEQTAARDVERTRKSSMESFSLNTEDRRISGNFESNRGRLPMPITGSYRVVSHFGQYNVEGLKNVTLDNKGINIQGQSGARARAIFNGEVSAVFSFGGTMVVMLRHGNYISVYCNLSSVNVHRGQSVHTRDVLGSVGSDNILQFQLRRETAKLNPEAWIGG